MVQPSVNWRGLFVEVIGVLLCAVELAAQDGPPKKYTETVKDTGVSFDMVLIPEGKFTMGSPNGEAGRQDHEGPAHEVAIKPFYLCTTEVTIELFTKYYDETVRPTDRDKDGNPAADRKDDKNVDAVTGPTPVYGDLTMGWGTGGRPAIAMTWENAIFFCKWLSDKTGKKYRLPTEAEWEYACRAGTTTRYFFGDDPAQLGEYAWFEENGEEATHPVAQKKPNPWGLYDTLGNVREWVYDYYDAEYYGKAPAQNPTGPAEAVTAGAAGNGIHVARGAAWDSPADDLRCAARGFEEDFWRFYDPQWPKSKWWLPKCGFVGLRVARSVDDK